MYSSHTLLVHTKTFCNRFCSFCLFSLPLCVLLSEYVPEDIPLCSLCRRTARNLSRDRMGVLMRLFQNLIYGFFVAFFVLHLDNDVSKGAVQDRIGIIYQSIGALPYTGMLNAVALCEFLCHTSAHVEGKNTYLLFKD